MRNKNAKVSNPNSFVCDPGSDEHILYSSKVLPSGEIQLTPCGKESIKEKINAAAQYCDINFIISRLQVGDTSVLRGDEPIYGDFTKVPKSLAESLQIIIDGERAFDGLPVETKQRFDNSYYQFIMTAGSEEWIKKLGIKSEEKVEVVENES